MRYFIIAFIAKNQADEVSYGNTSWESDNFPKRKRYEKHMADDGFKSVTILSIIELPKSDFESFNDEYNF